MGLIEQLKKRYKDHNERRFLKAHGCKTWQDYERRFDPDIGQLARWAHTFYHGYPYLYQCPNYNLVWRSSSVAATFTHLQKMTEWCETNCRGKWRNDWLRGFWDSHGNYEFNEIGGSDTMFFAFKEESDYMWFRLVWE